MAGSDRTLPERVDLLAPRIVGDVESGDISFKGEGEKHLMQVVSVTSEVSVFLWSCSFDLALRTR